MSLSKIIVLWTIRIYQSTISFDHGWPKRFYPNGYCRFYPSCSQYGYESVDKHGVLIGGIRTVWRILRCNPFSKGGHDPVI
ncbi:membrane protein insertion efficiency factor YidD [Candidatus Uhrbacteria bacterium RIFOXYB12_FULL_58_10]|nr:MAG: membrane protein insertion efficiency factor YidD [Candidatus Uhrbacteria bacterium RIFOXYB12_FULL_58_10]OGM00473.1 MAG: membrane protein insertion efficiency factor YidD [Candidatus Uhrbacteria bacterium RIFOXYC12_FULL_57_11]